MEIATYRMDGETLPWKGQDRSRIGTATGRASRRASGRIFRRIACSPRAMADAIGGLCSYSLQDEMHESEICPRLIVVLTWYYFFLKGLKVSEEGFGCARRSGRCYVILSIACVVDVIFVVYRTLARCRGDLVL